MNGGGAGRGRHKSLIGLVFAGPLLIVFAAFYLWPALNTILASFFRWGLLRPWTLFSPGDWDFVGISNYVDTFTSARFWNSALNTAVWLVAFPLAVTLGSLFLAVMIWQAPKGQRTFRTIFMLPMTISLVAAGVIWTFIYDPDFGVLSTLVRNLGIEFAIDWGPIEFKTAEWLSSPGILDLGFAQISLVNISLIVAGVWAFTGFGVITLTAGLTAVPDDLVDAARVDGARNVQIVRHVLVPTLRRPLIIVATVSVIFALRTFDVVWVITQGGPVRDTEVLAVTVWKQAFVFLDSPQAGTATALAVIMSVVLIVAAFPYLKGLIRNEGA